MSDVETRLRDLLAGKAGEMRLDPEMPPALRQRARRRRVGTGLLAGIITAGLLATAGVGIRAAIGEPPRRPGGDGAVEKWRGQWPHETRAEAEVAQAQADAGDPTATWQLDAAEVLRRYGVAVLEWGEVFFEQDPWEADALVIVIGDCPQVATARCPFEVDVTVERLIRPGPTGIYEVTGAEVIAEPDDPATEREIRTFVRDLMGARNMQATSSVHDMISRQAMDQYEAGENGLALWGPVDDPAFTGFAFRIGEIEATDENRYEVRLFLSERFDDRRGEEYIERLVVGPGQTLRGDELPLVLLEAYRVGSSPEEPAIQPTEAEVRDFVTAFLEARLAGSGAEGFLTEVAAEQYAGHQGGLYLYGEEHDPGLAGNYRGAEIVSVDAVDDSSYEVVISLLVYWLGDSDPSELTEILFVGPEGSGLMVRGAEAVDV